MVTMHDVIDAQWMMDNKKDGRSQCLGEGCVDMWHG